MRYLFEDFALDTDRRELRRGSEMISLAPQVFDLLDYLILNRERVVSKDELVRAIWKGRIISDAALTTRINVVRTAIGDDGEKQRLVKTLHRKGFRFIGAVLEHRGHKAEVSPATNFPSSAPHLSIVVLPFANLGSDPAQDYFVDGVTESLTTDLSRIGGSFVIGRHTAFSYKGKSVDLKQIGRELNIRYVLQGSVQRGGSRLRVNVQLMDADSGGHLWADRFDKPVADLLEMQDEIVARLARALDVQLVAAESRRAATKLNPDAADLYFQGRYSFNKGLTPEYLEEARGFLEQALAIDPDHIDALSRIATIEAALGILFLTDRPHEHLAAAETKVLRALSLAPDHAWAHFTLGVVLICTNRFGQGMAECERALALDPNLADAHEMLGVAKNYMGRATETEAHIHAALRLSPRDISAFRWMNSAGFSKLVTAADAEAAIWFARGIEVNRNYPLLHFGYAAALALLGRLEEAHVAAKAGLALDPGFTIRRIKEAPMIGEPAFVTGIRRFVKGLHIAGVPTG